MLRKLNENKQIEASKNDIYYQNFTSDRMYGGEDFAIEQRGKF